MNKRDKKSREMSKDEDAEEKMRGVKIKVTVEVTEKMLWDNLVSGIESRTYGANTWAQIDVGKHQPGWANYFTAMFKERDTGVVHKMSRRKLAKGFALMSVKAPEQFARIVSESAECDAITGDALIQCALLGDVVYS